jgi:uncharacterized membrane protein
VPHHPAISPGDIRIDRTIEIQRPACEIHAFWRNPTNLGSLLPGRVDVVSTSEGRSHWTVRGPLGRLVQWDANITRDIPGREIAWESDPGAEVRNSGVLTLDSEHVDQAPTVVTLSLSYQVPGGLLGKYLGEASRGHAEREVAGALAKVKRRLENAPEANPP